jgi:hypothetical protein
MPRGYKKDKEEHLSQLSFDLPAFQDMSLGAEELELSLWSWQARNLAVQRRFHCHL